MSKTMSIKEAAKLWDLSERRIRGLCEEGAIENAHKNGKSWEIPFDASRPVDNRVKKGCYIQKSSANRLPLPVGVSDYRLATSEYYYVDKTMMIKDFIDDRCLVTLFTRPRRFGKTLNMDMFATFFAKSDEDTSIYFKDKKIWQQGEKYRAYQGKYPLVFITLKDVKHNNWDDTKESIAYIVGKEYSRHSVLSNSPSLDKKQIEFYEKIVSGQCSDVELEGSLMNLSQMLHQHYGQETFVIVDEYDTPIQSGYANGFYDEVISFMRNLFSGCFKDNKHLAFGILTGILRVAKESIFSGLNNLIINSVLDNKYSEYFGFTTDEVRQMAKYYGCYDKLDEICEWYDGYRFGNNDIFNPWSVINYFNNGCEVRAFWLSTGSNDIIEEIIKEVDNEIYQRLSSLVNGESFTTYVDTSIIYPMIKANPSSIYSFLLLTGYLKVIKSSISLNGDFICEVALPNKEISLVYRKEILQRLDKIIPQPLAIAIEEALVLNNVDKLSEIINKLLIQSVSYFDTLGENFYHGFMLGICALFGNFYVTSNREAGDGRYDIALFPKTSILPGIIIELKAQKGCSQEKLKSLANEALEQIIDKKYDSEMRAKNIKTIYKYAVVFSGKNAEVAFRK